MFLVIILSFSFQEAFGNFQELEDRITYVATKVVHLGDQLESSNNRRARDFEAETLMRYLAEFYAAPKPTSFVFTDPGQVIMHYTTGEGSTTCLHVANEILKS